MKLENTRKDYSIKCIINGASHDMHPTREIADAEILEKYQAYKKKGSDSCESIKFKRSLEDRIDTENKNILSIGSEQIRIPVAAIRIANELAMGVPYISTVGNQYIGLIVKGFKNMLNGIFSDRISFISEYSKPGKLSWGKTLTLGLDKLERILKKDGLKTDYFHFSSVDIPLSQSDPYFLSPQNLADFRMHMNTRSVFMKESCGEFTPRNYYHKINGIDTKEGNRYDFSSKFVPILKKLGNIFYKNRENGEASKISISEIIKMGIFSSPNVTIALMRPSSIIHITKVLQDYKNGIYSNYHLQEIGKKGFLKTEFLAGHHDPWTLWDIDAYQDLNAYSFLLNKITDDGKKPENIDDFLIGGHIIRAFIDEILINGGLGTVLPLYNQSDEADHRNYRAKQLGIPVDVLDSMNTLNHKNALLNLKYQKSENKSIFSSTPDYHI